MPAAVARAPNGHWLPGHSGNPEGGRVVHHPRRFALTAERQLEEDPDCFESIVENLIDAMKRPEFKPLSAKLAFERLWPILAKHEGLQSAADETAGESEARWLELAEGADTAIPETLDPLEVNALERREDGDP